MKVGGSLKRIGEALCFATVICLAPVTSRAMHVTFSEQDAGRFPSGWTAREKAGEKVYSVRVDDTGVFLHAESLGNAHAIGRRISVSLDMSPFLNFSWRALSLPDGGDERSRRTNDGALGVYVVFEGWSLPPRTIKYVWSTTAPEDTVTTSPFSRKVGVIVLRSGTGGLGQWQNESVNVLEDYRRLFGTSDVPRVRGIAVLTDSDNTGSRSSGDYRAFRFSSREEKIAARMD